ncbi:hypothetical protein HGRIS_003152 [Hohenbuehelia grisea]|uniref:Hydrophobin n=1 Tax=Hohenbuehelia grisea TaxID=104357 RepID=A0ABR3JNH3_9AGAR
MFATIFVAALAATSALAMPQSSCNANAAGQQMCCNDVIKHNNPSVKSGNSQTGILDFSLDNLVGDIAVGCAIGGGCKQTAVCCTDIKKEKKTLPGPLSFLTIGVELSCVGGNVL